MPVEYVEATTQHAWVGVTINPTVPRNMTRVEYVEAIIQHACPDVIINQTA